MKIRRELYYNIITDTAKVRAVAMSLLIKKHIRSSAITDYTSDKLHKLTRLHADTCKKYVGILVKLNLAEFVGRNGKTLVFKKLFSRHQRKNIDLGDIDGSSVMDIAYHLYAIFNVEIVRHKLYAKHIIETATDGFKNVREAKRKSRKYGYGREFIENGLSFKTIAKRLKCGIQKAQAIIKFCVDKLFLIKNKHITQIYDKYAQTTILFRPDLYTFATKEYLYIVGANSYELGRRVKVTMPLVG